MTNEEILEAAKEAGSVKLDPLGLGGLCVEWLERFAAIIERKTIERCAVVCESAEVPIDIAIWTGTKKALTAATANGIAVAIRKLGEQ